MPLTYLLGENAVGILQTAMMHVGEDLDAASPFDASLHARIFPCPDTRMTTDENKAATPMPAQQSHARMHQELVLLLPVLVHLGRPSLDAQYTSSCVSSCTALSMIAPAACQVAQLANTVRC